MYHSQTYNKLETGSKCFLLPGSLERETVGICLCFSLPLNLELTSLTGLAGQQAPGSCLCFPGSGVIGACHYVWLLTQLSRTVLMLAWEQFTE